MEIFKTLRIKSVSNNGHQAVTIFERIANEGKENVLIIRQRILIPCNDHKAIKWCLEVDGWKYLRTFRKCTLLTRQSGILDSTLLEMVKALYTKQV